MPGTGGGLLFDSYGLCDHYRFCGCEPRGTIHITHVDCWKVANRGHSTSSLLHVARKTSLLFDGWHFSTGFPSDAGSLYVGLRGIEFSQEAQPGRLLARVSTMLPPELGDQILKGIPGDRVRVLAAVVQMAASLAPGGNPGLPAREWRTCPGAVTRIHAWTSSMFGRSYLRDISLNRGDGADIAIDIDQADIRSIRFAMDAHGLRGIRIIYDDRRESPWLGTGRHCWYGEMHGSNLARLSVIRDVGVHGKDTRFAYSP